MFNLFMRILAFDINKYTHLMNNKVNQKGFRCINFISKNNINNKFGLKIMIVQIFKKNLYTEISKLSFNDLKNKKSELLENNKNNLKCWEIDISENSINDTYYIIPHYKKFFVIIIFFNYFLKTKNKYIIRKDQYTNIIFSNNSFIANNKFKVFNMSKKIMLTGGNL